VQGWQTLLFKLKLSFDSDAAKMLNKKLFAHMYYAAWEESALLVSDYGCYSSFIGSPLQKGILHCDTWTDMLDPDLDWSALRSKVMNGVVNSLITTIMPTASTAQICGNTEACEPLTSNIYIRRTQAGEFEQVNGYLVKDLEALGLWNPSVRTAIVRNEGSIQSIDGIPDETKERYRTAFEISQKVIIEQARDRAPYIDQSQSMNLFMYDPTIERVSSMHMYAWRKGLKTGQYYLRSRPRVRAQQFTVEPQSCESCSA
jgi:ribonucleotide reductase alpha subunit